ncbi:hypothetical protein Tsubulata_037217 [Turnera subulata]|uniref:RRM domain-containing protein n=1 Tax=Turnera subulata TaxID=218843 RepID=A0A9Q0JJE8_9ROSI|nr:hypothetical protein Tsubulata_037217 [Turnera subulata]
MAVSRLLLSKPVACHRKRGIFISTRLYSSSGSATRKNDANEDRVAAVESNFGTKPKILPKTAEDETKAVGSWHSLKGIFVNFKERVLGTAQSEKQIGYERSHPPTNSATTNTSMSQTTEAAEKSARSDTLHLLSEAAADSLSRKESISTSVTSHFGGEYSSEVVVDTTVYEARDLHKCPDNIKLGEPDSAIQVGEALADSPSTKPDNMINLSKAMSVSPSDARNDADISASFVYEENVSKELVGLEEEMVQPEKISENSKIVNLEAEQKQGREMHNRSAHSDRGQQLLGFTCHLIDDVFGNMPNKVVNEFPSLEIETCQHEKKTVISKDKVNDGCMEDKKKDTTNNHRLEDNMEETPSAPVPKVDGVVDLCKLLTANQTEGVSVGEDSDLLTTVASSSDFADTSQENVLKTFDFDSLMGCIKDIPGEQSTISSQDTSISNVTDTITNGRSISNAPLRDEVPKGYEEGKNTSLEGHAMSKDGDEITEMKGDEIVGIPSITDNEAMSQNEECNNSDIPSNDQLEFETIPQISPIRKKAANHTAVTSLAKRHTESKVLLRFLTRVVDDSVIKASLADCGPIVKIQRLPSFNHSKFHDAFVHFETKEGKQKALELTEVSIYNGSCFFQETSVKKMAHKSISIPELIGDTDIPVALVKHPTRTIKIKHLTGDISLDKFSQALSFCGSEITSFFLGTSGSIAYVEFKEEGAKERALEKHSINVSGQKLLIFRVDAPRTTVVRINNVDTQNTGSVKSICKAYGKIRLIAVRQTGVVDVHYSDADWPNMLDTLNSLNGLQVEGRQWVAKPAPVFPPTILRVLWNHPEGRKHVKAVIRSLLETYYRHEALDAMAKHYEIETLNA